MAICLSKNRRCVTHLMGRSSAHGESQERQAVGVHGNREFHEGFSWSSGSFAVPVTGVVAGEAGCINRNHRNHRVGREGYLGTVMDQMGKQFRR